MNFYPIDLTAVILGGLGIMIILVPVLGLTVRLALKPVVDAFFEARRESGNPEDVARLERRIATLEARLGELDGAVTRLNEESDFRRQLAEPVPPSAVDRS